MSQTMIFATDIGPTCPVCQSTIYRYDTTVDGNSISFVPTCQGCRTVERTVRLGRLSRAMFADLTISVLRRAHERVAANRAAFAADVAARQTGGAQ